MKAIAEGVAGGLRRVGGEEVGAARRLRFLVARRWRFIAILHESADHAATHASTTTNQNVSSLKTGWKTS